PAIVAYKQVWEQPSPLHNLAPEVPPSLERIVMTCLQKDPRSRYPTADALAADLNSLGASFNRPTQAMPIGQVAPVVPVGSNRAPQHRSQAEISQRIPMAPQPAMSGPGAVPPVRAQTTNPGAGRDRK